MVRKLKFHIGPYTPALDFNRIGASEIRYWQRTLGSTYQMPRIKQHTYRKPVIVLSLQKLLTVMWSKGRYLSSKRHIPPRMTEQIINYHLSFIPLVPIILPFQIVSRSFYLSILSQFFYPYPNNDIIGLIECWEYPKHERNSLFFLYMFFRLIENQP